MFLRLLCAMLLASNALLAQGADVKPDTKGFEQKVKPLLARYCNHCHGGTEKVGGLAFDQLNKVSSLLEKRSLWQKMGRNVNARIMPPDGEPLPTAEEIEYLVGWIEQETNKVDCGLRDPGRVTIRRLNRAEYNNTIRDLLGIEFRPADDFPADDVGYGFDNIGDVLSLPPLLMEKYLAAAEQISQKAIPLNGPTGPVIARMAAKDLNGGSDDGEARKLTSSGQVTAEVKVPVDGQYQLRVGAFGDQAGDEPARMAVVVDRQRLKEIDVPATENKPGIYELPLKLAKGTSRIGLEFTNDYYMPRDPDQNNRDRNLNVQWIELVATGETVEKIHQKEQADTRSLITCRPTGKDWQACAEEIVRRLATRAFRRPARDEEIARLVKLVTMAQQDGESFEAAIRLAVQAVLVSPHFLFRIELDPEPNNPRAIHPINDYELATRLSYFLWSTMPDEELFRLASQRQLQRPEVLEQQVQRMLKDRKSYALVENFADQWLQIRNLRSVSPNRRQFESFNEKLRMAMWKETQLFFETVMREDRSILEFLDADFTFLNEPLARHYGIADVKGDEFRRVQLDTDQRGGVLTQASVLTITSNPTRTSPVKRGKWILEQLLGTPPPPPPPGVPELANSRESRSAATLRQRLEQHREKASCAACHRSMDPLGFGLENYDAIGAWRTNDGRFPIDASGELPDGRTFNGPKELKGILLARSPDFVRTLSENLLTFALGRGLEYYDKCAVDDIADYVIKHDHRFSALVVGVVRSEPFLKRRGKGVEP